MLSQEIERLTNIINSKNTENNTLNMKLHDLEGMNRTIQVLQEKISRLTGENFSLGEDMKNAQDSLRLSTSQASKVTSELNDLKNRVHVLTSELESKNREIRSLNDRLGETEGTKEQIKRENMTLSQRMIEIDRLGKDIGQLQQNIIKLTKENQALNTEYLSTQENLRVSTSQTAKLAAELTELRNRVAEYEVRIKRADDELLRYKQENSNHQQRFQEIEKQTRIMGDLQKQVIALAKENEMLTQDNARAQESLRVSTS
jgi:chromosome segregation ATPase